MIKRILRIVFYFILLMIIGTRMVSVSAQTEIQQVLIINSYHQGYGWADTVMHGIYDTLIESEMAFDIHIEYMDTKRYPAETLYTELYHLYDEKYNFNDIDLMIIADDNALDFVLAYYDQFDDIPIVFCGLGYLEKYDFSQYPLITGLGESSEYLENFQLIEQLQPEVNQIVLVAGATETAKTGVLSFQDAVNKYGGNLKFQVLWNMPIEDLLKKIELLEDDTAIILVPFARDADDQFIGNKLFVDLLAQRTDLPIYSAFSFEVKETVVGGRVIDGLEHGSRTAEIALSILNGKEPSDFPIVYDGGHGNLFNYDELMRRGISLKSLPEDSDLINEPTTIFYQFREEIISLSILLVSLIGIIGILWFTIGKQRELERELQHMVSKDILTGLNNRHAYYKKMEDLRKGPREELFPVGITFLDINGLKKVNDTFGHRVGDEYIQMMADVLRAVANPDDFLARIGGDEFVCILEQVSQLDLAQFVQKVNSEMNRKAGEISDYVFSSSLGVSICYHEDELIQCTHAADMAMYQKKKGNPHSTGRLPSTHI